METKKRILSCQIAAVRHRIVGTPNFVLKLPEDPKMDWGSGKRGTFGSFGAIYIFWVLCNIFNTYITTPIVFKHSASGGHRLGAGLEMGVDYVMLIECRIWTKCVYSHQK
jgi:hypothetical protein